MSRLVRLARLSRTLRELWLLMVGLGDLFKTVLWVSFLLLLIFWVFGILMTISVGQNDETYFDYSRSHWTREDYFGTVPKSMFSMFQIMTLDKWSSALIYPVLKQWPWFLIFIIPFLCMTSFGLMNIIVGVVVESTLSSAASNEEFEGKEIQKMHAKVMESLRAIFNEADADRSGTIDREEIHRMMQHRNVRERMKILDIPTKDLDLLFGLLDEQGLGEIRTEKFFRGCSRLRGPALACDMHRMSIDLSRYINFSTDLVEGMDDANKRMENLLAAMEEIDRDIIKGENDDLDPVYAARRTRVRRGVNNMNNESPKRNSRWLSPEEEAAKQDRSNSKGDRQSRSKDKGNSLVRMSLSQTNIGFDMGELRRKSKEGVAERPETPPQPPPPPLPKHLAGGNRPKNTRFVDQYSEDEYGMA